MSAEIRFLRFTKLLNAITVFIYFGAVLIIAHAASAEENSDKGLSRSRQLIFAQARKRQQEPAGHVTPAAPSDSLEVRFWTSIKNSEVAADFRTYLDAYPDGHFVAQARSRLRQIEAKGAGASTMPESPTIKPAPEAATSIPSTMIRDCPQCPQLVLIPAGAFSMGSTELFPFEGPVHQVTIRKSFYMGQREVTLGEWDACVADDGCSYSPPHHSSAARELLPATNLDWNDAQQYVAWLTKKTGKTYRLPSESEWEYAARAGGATTYPWGWTMEKNRANCSGCNDQPNNNPVPTGSYPPNSFGLYDMAGNAAEWVEDCWNDSYKSSPTDGSAWTKPQCQERVLRGGSFNNDPRYLRSASRFKYDFDVRYYANGFRVVREY
jgi:formylglycine-generating enzyme required for sulfatase activity